MGWMTCKVGVGSYCAFCKHWYDPANSNIIPVAPVQGMWKVNMQAKSLCTLTNTQPIATHRCDKFESKL